MLFLFIVTAQNLPEGCQFFETVLPVFLGGLVQHSFSLLLLEILFQLRAVVSAQRFQVGRTHEERFFFQISMPEKSDCFRRTAQPDHAADIFADLRVRILQKCIQYAIITAGELLEFADRHFIR